MQALRHRCLLRGIELNWCRRLLTQSYTGNEQLELTNEVKHRIETHWRQRLKSEQFDARQKSNKYYVLSMFPYPSGNLHMGHVRVYSISDAVARFHRMCGKNVFQPIGWDSFGLPAENAANQRGVAPAEWTQQNIGQMKQQLERLGCSFDWSHELSTSSPEYYKWTQSLFLMLHKQGLAYQNEALVNWDPVDKTVLADEQVDANGCSWRSGAKVEKKLLKQWFIRTSAYAKQLLDGLDDPTLRDWRDIINLQRHWIGECNGYAFTLLTSASNLLRVWTANPEHLKDPHAFLVLRSKHFLSKVENAAKLSVENPFAGRTLPVLFNDEVTFPAHCDVYLAAPSFRAEDRELWDSCDLAFAASGKQEVHLNPGNWEELRKEVLQAARRLNVGGYRVSSKLQDWLISRQRYWGTPIPIVHCPKCGAVPVPEQQLPVTLPPRDAGKDALRCECPKCDDPHAQRETDTMDTFVDSSWYYLRYLDAHNTESIFDLTLAKNFMPVDLYIGGKEHAVLHLYYARFMNHFLHNCGLSPTSEPFSRLLVQGMVMGRSYRVKGSGRYVRESEVEIVNAKKNQAVLKGSQEPVVMSWEKMSKSKLNGVEPDDMFNEYGTDTTRLIILADVAPTSHRNWSSATFPGILNWQKRLWLTMEEFRAAREDYATDAVDTASAVFREDDAKLFDARNFYVKGATFNYRHAHQLSVAISKMQGLTNSIRRTPKHIQSHGKQFERALAAQIIMLAPMAPHFASELWSKFVAVPGRLNVESEELRWTEDVLAQRWPDVDAGYQLDLSIKVNGFENCVIKVARNQLDKVSHSDAMDIAFNTQSVTSYLIDKKIRTTNFVLYPGIEAILNIYVDKLQKTQKPAGGSSNDADKLQAK
ncbi:probable leucine--tRNA ligase, mitochondrial [Drosophila grimshawi]|uniref:leucine--tRNA ligase n=1 Tax=Drosophila grimshawi TaxID=7222 RepID=B4IZ63_DROGR|nr:probable leucine--tRNA ligase, mitochondrial [Drosophila grimshawi]EDV95585.1 GH15697 [Drosophila grimshawi]